MTLPPALREFTLLLVCLLLAVGSAAVWVTKGRAHSYPDAPHGEFACLSYTPRDESNVMNTAVTKAEIERDLRQLSQRTHCIRTYAQSNGLDQVPDIARQFGMKVLLGIWIDTNEKINEFELNRAIEIANTHRDVIEAIIVGNEVLLRHEQTADVLRAMLKRVRTATQLPVTYADVWEFWLQHPELAQDTDFVTIHILPYWEDDPVSIDMALPHVRDIYSKVQGTFPDKRIYVGETGWPSAGRQREAARPTLLNQARFTRDFIAYASAHNLPYNFIEAYDQPWKRAKEGTVGGYWGLYDAAGHQKFPLTGAVVEDPRWWRGPVAGVVVALIFAPLAWRARTAGKQRIVAIIAAGFALGCLLSQQWEYLLRASRSWQEWSVAGAWSATCIVVFIAALFGLDRSSQHIGRFRLQLALLLGVAYIEVGLVFDARYRDFPSEFLVLPAVMLFVSRWVYGRWIGNSSREQALFASWILLSVPLVAIEEGLQNISALAWCALCVLLSLATLPAITHAQVQHRTKQQT